MKLLGQNYLDAATVTVTTTAPGSSAARLYDRIRSAVQCTASGAAQWDIKVDLGASPSAVTDFSVHGHNLGVAGIVLAYSDDDVSYTDHDTFTGTSGTDLFRTVSTQTRRYWRQRVPAFASAPAVGEFVLGTATTISVDPAYDPGPVDIQVGHVDVRRARGGARLGLQLGSGRRSLRLSWNLLPDSDWQNLLTFFATVKESAQPFAIQDQDGTARWVELLSPTLEGQRVHRQTATTYYRRVVLDLQEVL